MTTIYRFEDIEAWQLSRELYKKIFLVTSTGKFAKDYSLKDQIRRSSGSIMDNIAEGFERDGNKEFKQFLSYSKGSTGEVKSQLYRAFDSDYITREKFDELYEDADYINNKIKKLMIYISSSGFKGVKFK